MFFQQTLGRGLRLFPNATALIDGEQRLSFVELDSSVRRLAAGLRELGLSPGDRLAALLPNGREFLELTFACAYLGLVFVPLNTRLAVAELDSILSDCTPKLLIEHGSLPRPSYCPPLRLTLGEHSLPSSPTALPEPIYAPQSLLGLFYTSGTSGQPKGVMLTHLNHVANMLHCGQSFEFHPGDVFLHVAPLFHMADFQLLPATTSQGATQVTLARFDPEAFCSLIEREKITHTVLIPTMLNLLTLHPSIRKYDLTSLRCILYGGSSIAPEVIARCRQTLPGCRLMQGYGMTETGPIMTLLQDPDHTGDRVLSCGQVVPGVELRIADENGVPVTRGERGIVYARGLSVMLGYWNKPEDSERALRGGWMNTGDIAYEDADGYFYIVDRQKDMIITGGENVYPTEVEIVLYAHPAVKEAAVVAAPDPTWGELVIACVHLKSGHHATEDELRRFCRERLAGYKTPKRFDFFATELPKGGTGKILRRQLRAAYWRQGDSSS